MNFGLNTVFAFFRGATRSTECPANPSEATQKSSLPDSSVSPCSMITSGENLSNGTVTFASGAKRSDDRAKERYDLISPLAMQRLAATCHEGAEKYSDYNWEKGMPISEFANHAIAHIYIYLSGDRSEDHLAHAAWNLFGAMHSEELWPGMNRNLRGPGCVRPG